MMSTHGPGTGSSFPREKQRFVYGRNVRMSARREKVPVPLHWPVAGKESLRWLLIRRN